MTLRFFAPALGTLRLAEGLRASAVEEVLAMVDLEAKGQQFGALLSKSDE